MRERERESVCVHGGGGVLEQKVTCCFGGFQNIALYEEAA
jgi:hypothetical protein